MRKILYHFPCADGTTAATIALMGWPGSIAIPVSYGKPPPELGADDDVVIVDFSYPRAVLEEIRSRVKSLLVLDHHKTAQAELSDLNYALFDMQKCGSGMTWDYFSWGKEWPYGLRLIQDRDLWQHKYMETDAMTAGLGLLDGIPGPAWWRAITEYEETVQRGATVLVYQGKLMERTVPHAMARVWHDCPVMVLNTTVLHSDLGHRLLELNPVAKTVVMWQAERDFVRVSLRSRTESECDVSALAKLYPGGGGHACAAGFELSPEAWWKEGLL